jgi:hypothetical protein
MRKGYHFSRGILNVFLLLLLVLTGSCRHLNQSVNKADDECIQSYLDGKVLNPSFGGKVFSSHKILLVENDKIYVWGYLQEYYKKTGILEEGTGMSGPLVLNIKKDGDKIAVISHVAPRDGDLYSADIRNLFPKQIRELIIAFPESSELKELRNITRKRAEKMYFF